MEYSKMAYLYQIWTKGWEQMKPTWSFVPLTAFIAFAIGGIAWIIVKITGVESSIIANIIGLIAVIGLIGVIYNFLVGAPHSLWKQDAPLREIKQNQSIQMSKNYLWAILQPIEWRDGGTKTYITIWLVSCLIENLPYRRISGIIKYKHERLATFEVEKTNSYIPKLASWHESAELVLTRVLSAPIEKYTITADLKVECDTGEITIEQIYEAQPKNGN